MGNILYTLFIFFLFLNFPTLISSQDSKEVDIEFENFKALKKKELEERKTKEKEQEYKDFLEFQEYKNKKSAETKEEKELQRKREEGKVAYSPWAVQYGLTSGFLSVPNEKSGRSTQFLVAAEYHVPESKFGYRLGLSIWNYNYGYGKERFERDALNILYFTRGNIFLPYLLDSSLLEKRKVAGYGVDFIVDYHFNPRKFVDPYLFGGFGVGVCDKQCNMIKISAGGGVRINLRSGYVLSELIFEKPFFALSPADQTTVYPNFFMAGIRIGFGMFL
jgi:hypothetical protein